VVGLTCRLTIVRLVIDDLAYRRENDRNVLVMRKGRQPLRS